MSALLDVYLTQFKIGLAGWVQYRAGLFLQFVAKMAEPIIYLVVWRTIATQSGGEVGGFTADEFSAYFILWTLVRMMTVAWDPFWMERRIRQGEFSALLLRPIHPFHPDTAQIIAGKVIELGFLIPVMTLLALLFRPQLEIVPWALAAFVPVLALAFLLRYVLAYALAMTAFWTTRVTALFELWFATEFFVSGRIAPVAVLPEWAQQVSLWLPFRWMFYFPLETALGRLTPQEVLQGVGIQLAWLAVSAVAVVISWRSGVRRYTAVGG